MDCPYSNSVLANASDAREYVVRCETCRRHIIFFSRRFWTEVFDVREVRSSTSDCNHDASFFA